MVKPKKDGRGRTALGKLRKNQVRSPLIGIRLPSDEIAAIDALAKREGVKRSEMVRRLIEAGRESYTK